MMQEASFDHIIDELLVNCKEKLPDFSNSDTVICFSDYSGDNDLHKIYSFLFVDLQQAIKTHKAIDILRLNEPEWKSKSWIEYKKLNKDRVRRRLLPEFLELANELHGILFTFSIHERADDIIVKNGSMELSSILKNAGHPWWKPHIARKLTEVIFLKCYCAKKLISESNNYIWLSDRDAINDEGKNRIIYTSNLLERGFEIFDIKRKSATIATNRIYNDPTNFYGDMLSICDLVSGAVTEVLDKKFGDNKMKVPTFQTLSWFEKSSPTLSKLHINISPYKNGNRNTISILRLQSRN